MSIVEASNDFFPFAPSGEYGDVGLNQIRGTYDLAYTEQAKRGPVMATEIIPGYQQATKAQIAMWCRDIPLEFPIVDAGCGDGSFGKYLGLYAPCHTYFGFDVSEEGVKIGQTKNDGLLKPVVASLTHPPFEEGTVGAFVFADSLEHAPNPKETLEQVYKMLREGGNLFVSVPYPGSFRNWTQNMILQGQLGASLIATRAGFRRRQLFGKTQFQPIDHELYPQEWAELFEISGFQVEQYHTWPNSPLLRPVVTTYKTKKRNCDGS